MQRVLVLLSAKLPNQGKLVPRIEGALIAVLLLAGWSAGLGPNGAASAQDTDKPRVVVTTDPELDDLNSLIRYLLYTNELETEGLIYASSQFHWKGDGEGTEWWIPDREYTRFGLDICPCESWRWAEDEQFVHDAVGAYEEVYDNLIVHDQDYPSPSELMSKIRVGNVEFEGDISEDSPGSDYIKSLLLDAEEGPLYLLAWGGQSTIARALKSIRDQYRGTLQWPNVRSKVSEKAVILAFADQDDTYTSYIEPNWPEIEFRNMANSTFGYGARGAVLPEDQVYLSADWTGENISSRGPLGELYRVWGDGKQMVEGDIFDYFGFSGLTDDELREMGYVVWLPVQEEGSFISEGDTPTYMNLLDNGLRGWADSTYGGWGGRQGADVGPGGPDPDYSSARFFGAAQRDFAARMAWSVTPAFSEANHQPEVRVEGLLDISARPGETIRVEAAVSDPDSGEVSVRWWQYEEVDSYPGPVSLSDTSSLAMSVEVPTDAAPGSTIHLILEATDDGTPALTRYQRVVVTITP